MGPGDKGSGPELLSVAKGAGDRRSLQDLVTRFPPVFFMRAVSQRFPQMTVHIYQFMGLWIGNINHLIQLFKKFPNVFHRQSFHYAQSGSEDPKRQ